MIKARRQRRSVALTILVLGRDSNEAAVSSYEDLGFDRVDSVTTPSIPVLRSRFRYCEVGFPVLQRQFRYYSVDSGTTQSIPVLPRRFRYYRVDSGTTASIPVLRSRFRYYGVDSGTTESIPVLQSRLSG